MTVLKNIEPRFVLGPEGKARVDSVPSVPSVPNGNHIGNIGPKDQTMPRTWFFLFQGLFNVFSTCLTPKVRGEGGRGSDMCKNHLWFFFKFTAWNY